MIRILFFLAAFGVFVHGLIHVMGFVAYWPLAEVSGLPYKTTLLGERWSIGATGMRVYGALWLVPAVGLAVSMIGLVTAQPWWFPLTWVALVASLILTALDWSNAFRGALLSLVVMVPLLLVWGLRIQPRPFAPITQSTPESERLPLPAGLPAPVERYFQAITAAATGSDTVQTFPVLDSAVITARGTLRFAGITFPARLRFTHDAGQGYRHYIEATLFGRPLMKVNERYIDGRARMELPVGVVENEPRVDMAANLGLWGESIWLPSIYLTDSRVRWEAIGDNTARLIVPFEDTEDAFTVFFDEQTGLIQRLEAMRYRDAADTEKILWQLEPLAWGRFHGLLIPTSSTATWADEGTPWLVIEVEEVAYNVDVARTIRQEGP